MGRWMQGLVCLAVAGCFTGAATVTHAATVHYTTHDLGGGLWRYSYTVSGWTFGVDEGLAIFFDPAFYGELTNPQPDTDPLDGSTTDVEWDVLLLQPDLSLLASGVFDALALVALPSSLLFSIDVEWLGTTGTIPGSQPFDIYSIADGEVLVLTSGSTRPASPVPEPATALLLAGALTCAMARRRRR
jgi:hypothetical protein